MDEKLTREEAEKMMQENLERVSQLVDLRVREALQVEREKNNIEFESFSRNYKIYNATNIPVLPKGTMVLIDTRAVLGASGVVAKYSSLGDRYVEEWAKQVNP